VNPAGLPVGSYTGTITLTSGGAANSPLTVTVNFTVNASVNLSAAPASLAFSYQVGGTAPAAQALNIASSGASLSFTASVSTSSGGGWLTVNPPGAAAPATLSIMAIPSGLAPGSYSGAVTITALGASNSPLTIPVALVVTSNLTLTVNPGSLAFNFQAGGPAPASQTLSVASSGVALNFTASASTTTGGNWLGVSPTGGGVTPATLSVSANAAGLAAGNYIGSITVASTGAVNSPQTIGVTLTVTAVVPPSVIAVVNAASWVPGPVAPGEVITIGGSDVGPPTLTTLQLDAAGLVATTLAETRVLFDGVAAPLIYVSKSQTSAIVPYIVAGRTEVQLQVEYKGVRSTAIRVRVADSVPGIFTQASNGRGPGAVLNQNFKLNTAVETADKGSVVMIFATGEGQTDPPGIDGKIAVSPVLPKPLLPVTVQIGGETAEVLYKGAAPGNVAGLIQINAKIPANAPSGPSVPISVTIGGVPSQAGVTIAIK
jgi:uncharacterized protein (TIGR03437 family)